MNVQSEPAKKNEAQKRKIRNFLLMPKLQLRLGLYYILSTLIYCSGIGYMVAQKFKDFASDIIELTEVAEEIRADINGYILGMQTWILVVIGMFVLTNVLLSIIWTHRIVGPTIAFRRHIKNLTEGNYNFKTVLRKGDAFTEVADDLNLLSESLKKRT